MTNQPDSQTVRRLEFTNVNCPEFSEVLSPASKWLSERSADLYVNRFVMAVAPDEPTPRDHD